MGSARRLYLLAGIFHLVVLEALLVPAILFWPDFAKSIAPLKALAPLDVLKDLVSAVERTGVEAYVHIQHFFKGCHALGGVVAVLLAVLAVSAEAWRGTLEIQLARPIPRWRLFAERWTGGALALVGPVFATTLTIPWLLARVGERMELSTLALGAVHESLFLLAIYAAAFLASCLSDKPFAIAFVALLLAVFQFAIYVVKVWTHWSVFRLADPFVFERLARTGSLDPALALPLAGFVALCTALAWVSFARRTP